MSTMTFEEAKALLKKAEIRLHEDESKLDEATGRKPRALSHREVANMAELMQAMTNIDRRWHSVCEEIEKHMPQEVTRRYNDNLLYIATRMGL